MIYVCIFIFIAAVVDIFTSPLIALWAACWGPPDHPAHVDECVFIYNLFLYGAAIFFGLTI